MNNNSTIIITITTNITNSSKYIYITSILYIYTLTTTTIYSKYYQY